MRRIVALVGAVLTLGVAAPAGSIETTAEGPRAAAYPPETCPKVWRSVVARNRIRRILLTTDASPDRRKVRRYVRCVETRAKARAGARVAAKAAEARRTSYGLVWGIRLNRIDAGWRGWAEATAWCESKRGTDPRTNLNGFRGIFQWVSSTWREALRRAASIYGPAPSPGDPAYASYENEAVAAIVLARTDSKGHWPNCG